MNKIFRYELRRLIWNKFFIGLLLINCVYAWYVFTTDTIAGVAYTAPFSGWSYGAYLSSVMPFSVLTVLFLVSLYHSKKEKQVESLTSTTSVNRVHYALVRSGAIAVCFLLLCAALFSIITYLYGSIFEFRNVTAFLLTTPLVALPCFVFAVGLGSLAGRIHQGLQYALMLVALAVGFAGEGGIYDFYGSGYFNQYPLTLPVGLDGEPAFILSAGFFIARGVYLLLGIILYIIAIQAPGQKQGKHKQG